MPDPIASLRVKIFADGADRASILELAANPWIKGFTTNPTLMRKAGITDYESFGRALARAIPERPFSFEVLSDDFDEMEQQALRIASWGEQRVREDSHHRYARPQFGCAGGAPGSPNRACKVNVTAMMTLAPGGRRSSRASAMARRAAFRSSPAASPTPVAIRCPSCAERWSASAPIRKSS